MAPGTEHHGGIWEPEPVYVEPWEVAHKFTYERMPFAGQHHPIREADGVRGWGHKPESSEGAHGSPAIEVHIQDDACPVLVTQLNGQWNTHTTILVQHHVPQRIDLLDWIPIPFPHLFQVRELFCHERTRVLICPEMRIPSYVVL